ncbi:hypothetical protein, partial [Cellulomonas hominis]|uniref:hypothetical protein n=1 Tax=Cellulomonas hominis TaxID=156981 RepID=UPI001BCB7159
MAAGGGELHRTGRGRRGRAADAPSPRPGAFRNAADTDPAVAESREWAAGLVARDVEPPAG